MPTLEGAIRGLLRGDTALAAITTRIRPINAAQGETRPLIAYQIDDGENIPYLNGTLSTWARAEFAIVAIGSTYDQCAEISRHVKRILGLKVGNTEGVRIAPCRFVSESDIEQALPEGQEKPDYIRQQLYRVQYRPLS